MRYYWSIIVGAARWSRRDIGRVPAQAHRPATNTALLRARRHDLCHYPIKLISLNAHRLLNIIIVPFRRFVMDRRRRPPARTLLANTIYYYYSSALFLLKVTLVFLLELVRTFGTNVSKFRDTRIIYFVLES